MEYSGEYYMCPIKRGQIYKKLLKNKTKTSWISFPNGIRNKVYLNINREENSFNLYILYPLDKNKKIKLLKKKNYNEPPRLVMYETEEVVASN